MRKVLMILSLALAGGLTLLQPASATTDVTMQTFWAASGGETSGGNEDGINLFWGFINYPNGASEPTLTPSTVSAWIYGGGGPPPSMAEGHYAAFEWTSVAFMGNVVAGSDLAVGVPFRRYCSQTTGNVEVKARVSVNETDRLDDFILYLEDDAALRASSSVIGSLSDGNFVVVTATFDLSASPFSNNAT